MQARGFGFGGQAAAHMRGRDPMRQASLLMTAILVLLSALPGPAEAAKKKSSNSDTSSTRVYRWVDANGVVHYSAPPPKPARRQSMPMFDSRGVTARSRAAAGEIGSTRTSAPFPATAA